MSAYTPNPDRESLSVTIETSDGMGSIQSATFCEVQSEADPRAKYVFRPGWAIRWCLDHFHAGRTYSIVADLLDALSHGDLYVEATGKHLEEDAAAAEAIDAAIKYNKLREDRWSKAKESK